MLWNAPTKKFIKRFQYLESKAGELGKPLMDMTLAEMDVFWKKQKSYNLSLLLVDINRICKKIRS
jgi:uncharacterized protein YabN with tetrapyrrole methylase and pyrophosphatase domain